MKFKLTATSIPYTLKGGMTVEADYLKEYIEKIKNADVTLDLPDPIIDDGHVYICLMYSSQIVNLAKTVGEELIVCINNPEPTIEIYDSWRE